MAATAQDILNEITALQKKVNSLEAKVDILLDSPKPTASSFTQILKDGREGKIMELEATLLNVGLNKQGEKAYKLKGRPYTKHGVPLYDDGDRFEAMGIDRNAEYGDTNYSQKVEILVTEPKEEGKLPTAIRVLGLVQ